MPTLGSTYVVISNVLELYVTCEEQKLALFQSYAAAAAAAAATAAAAAAAVLLPPSSCMYCQMQ